MQFATRRFGDFDYGGRVFCAVVRISLGGRRLVSLVLGRLAIEEHPLSAASDGLFQV